MTTAPTNYVGGALFWLYILAALTLTAIVSHTLYTLYTQHPKSASRNKTLLIRFTALALLSFGTLSYNMLSVLYRSFEAWYAHSFAQSPESLLVGIWKWSVSSTLFLDFGEAIVAWESDGRWFWVLGALMATLETGMWMGFEGTRRRVPHLWAFFGLVQILPVSFTVNLFFVALLLLPEDEKEVGKAPVRAPPVMEAKASWAVVAAYSVCVIASPYAAETPWLLPLILAARLLLFVPLLLAQNGLSSWGPSRRPLQVVLSMTITRWGHKWAANPGSTVAFIGEIVNGLMVHPAVASLGCDWILYLLSAGLWLQTQETLEKSEKAEEKKKR